MLTGLIKKKNQAIKKTGTFLTYPYERNTVLCQRLDKRFLWHRFLSPARLFPNHFWPLLQTAPWQQKELQLSGKGCVPAGWPRPSCNQHEDHRAIIHLSLRNTVRSTEHLNMKIMWETAAVGRGCCVSTKRHSSLQQGTRPLGDTHTTTATAHPAPKQKPQVPVPGCLQKNLAQLFPWLNKHPSLSSTFLHWISNKTSMWFWRMELSLFFKAD